MDERERIAMLAMALRARPEDLKGIEVGIGDDAAVLTTKNAGARLVWTIDEQVDGVHFRRDLASWDDIGWRSFMAAASDVAAMGARPWCALSALVLPDDVDDRALERIACAQREAGEATGAPVVGGNMASGLCLSIATTLLGTCARAIERRGARPGSSLWMAGPVGLAAAGLKALERGVADDERLAAAALAWRRPRARIAEGLTMAGQAQAAVDVSDGLARDAGHMADASGVCIVFDAAALLSDAALVGAAVALSEDALHLALYGGEDYALLAASDGPIAGFRRIGEYPRGPGRRVARFLGRALDRSRRLRSLRAARRASGADRRAQN